MDRAIVKGSHDTALIGVQRLCLDTVSLSYDRGFLQKYLTKTIGTRLKPFDHLTVFK